MWLWLKLTQDEQALHSTLTSFASADLRCVTSRLKMKLARVRLHSMFMHLCFESRRKLICLFLFKMLRPEATTTRIKPWLVLRYVFDGLDIQCDLAEKHAFQQNPPLYLHITSTNKDGLEKAVVIVDDLMRKELPNLVDERRFRRREPPEPIERDEYGRV